jgi:site-specific DNA-methyltransferase (adenine-specific)
VSTARYLIGDVFDVMATLPDDSVDLVLTSPPFLALRSYLPADHLDKGREIGQEPTPAEFLDTLLALTAEWGRLLAPHGSIAVELGDSYSGGGGLVQSREHRPERDGTGADGGARVVPVKECDGWPLAKSLCGIPTLYAWSLAYGRNLLTGEESPAGQWRIRNVVAWVRPNPPVGALGDKFRPATSYITIATQARDRWFDLDAVRGEPVVPHEKRRRFTNANTNSRRDDGQMSYNVGNPGGAPPLDWWEVPTEGYSGSHYATWPRKLLTKPIESMCPRHVCRTCGEPRRRLVESCRVLSDGTVATTDFMGSRDGGVNQKNAVIKNWHHTERNTTGWTDCGHDDYRRGIVLDPFAGSGTTLAVATGLGRDAIGIDLDARNADLARERVGMLLEVAS